MLFWYTILRLKLDVPEITLRKKKLFFSWSPKVFHGSLPIILVKRKNNMNCTIEKTTKIIAKLKKL